MECTTGETERLNGATRHGVHDEWGWSSQAKTWFKCGSSSTSGGCDLPFICMRDRNMTPEEMQKTESSILRAPRTHTKKIACIPRNFPQAKIETKVAWNENLAMQQAPQEEAQRVARNQYSKFMWTYEDAELCEASEIVGNFLPPMVSRCQGFHHKNQ